MSVSPNYVLIRSKEARYRWKSGELAAALGFPDDVPRLQQFLTQTPQGPAWADFQTYYLAPRIALGNDPAYPYRDIGEDGANYKRPHVTNTYKRALKLIMEKDVEFSGPQSQAKIQAWTQADHYVAFILRVVLGNIEAGGIWEGEEDEHDNLLALCHLSYLVLDHLVAIELYADQSWYRDAPGPHGRAGGGGGGDNRDRGAEAGGARAGGAGGGFRRHRGGRGTSHGNENRNVNRGRDGNRRHIKRENIGKVANGRIQKHSTHAREKISSKLACKAEKDIRIKKEKFD